MRPISRGLALLIFLLLALAGSWLRISRSLSQPLGLHEGEIADIRIAKSIQQGDIRVFYTLEEGMGRESLYHGLVSPIQLIFPHPTMGFRLVGIWGAALVMAALYALARRLVGRGAAILAVATWSLGFAPVLFSRNIGRESLIALPILITLLLSVNRMRKGRIYRATRSERNPIRLLFWSATIGFSLYLHPSAIGLALGSLIYLLFRVRKQREYFRRNWPYLLFALILLAIIALPYFISTAQNPSIAGFARWLSITSESENHSRPEIRQVLANIAGLFWRGDEAITVNLPGRPLYDPLSAILIALGLAQFLRLWRLTNYQLLLITGAFLIIPPFMMVDGPDQLSFAPIIPILAIFLSAGAVRWWKWISARGIPAISGYAAVLVLPLVLFYETSQAVFERWPDTDGHEVAFHRDLQVMANYLDESARELPTVICALPSRSAPQRLNATDILLLLSSTEESLLRFVDCRQGLVFSGGGSLQQFILLEPDVLSEVPAWFQEWLTERAAYPELGAELGLPLTGQVVQIEVVEPLANLLGSFTTTRPLRFPREREEVVAPAIRYGGNLTLLGYVFVEEEPYEPGQNLPIDIYWRAEGMVPEDIQIYLHLVANEADLANITAQADTVSVAPETLQSGDIWVHRMRISLPETAPEGRYLLLLGAYQAETGVRMPVYDLGPGAHIRGDYMLLPDVMIASPASAEE